MGANLRPLIQASGPVPIVFVDAPDPVGAGYVKTLARPGGNVTGILSFEFGIVKKWIELLRQIAPAVKQVTTIHDPTVSAEVLFGSIPSPQSRTQLNAANLRDNSELERTLTALAATPNSGVIIASEAAIKYRGRIVTLVNCTKAASDLLPRNFCSGRRPDLLCPRFCGPVSSCRGLCCSHFEGRETGRPSSTRAVQIQSGYQCEDR